MYRVLKGSKAEKVAYLYGLAVKNNQIDLYSVYKSPSTAKISAYNEIVAFANAHGYRDVRIISYNSFHYTVGYRNGRELIVETANYIYKIPINTLTILHYVNADF